MKRFAFYITAAAVWICGCSRQNDYYNDKEYVMFADAESVNIIQEDACTFSVPVASTVACNYDRNFGVEVLDRKSNAVEGLHYRLSSNTVTIKAGERVANMEITANYDEMKSLDTLNIALKLLLPDAVKWDLYGDETEVKMVKTGTWKAENFTGWCVVSSRLLYDYPGNNTDIKRLIFTELHPTEKNTVILHSFLYDGYDVSIRFETENPAKPFVTMDEDQVLSDCQSVFWTVHGDDKLLVRKSPYFDSYYNALDKYALLYLYVHVMDLGEEYGIVDPYSLNSLAWVSDEEADRLEREDGMTKRP